MKDNNGMTATPVEPIVMRSSRVTVTLYHGDCLKLLPIEADAVVSDPPYGMRYKSGANSSNSISSTGKRFTERIIGDDVPFDPSPWMEFPEVVFTGAHWFYDRLPPGGGWHTWNKRGDYKPLDQADADHIWCKRQSPSRVFGLVWRGICRHAENADEILHPTQKPVALMEWMLGFLQDAKTVVDPYMGSGTTGVACIRRGLNFVGIEKDAQHFKNAVERIRRELSQERLF